MTPTSQPPHMSEGPGAHKVEQLNYMADEDQQPDRDEWLERAQQSFHFSTTYVDANYRKKWEDSLKAFNNQHAADSKYNSDSYAKRSKIFRPKTRSVIRKNEAAGASAFFSNMDVVSVLPMNQGDVKQRASAEIMKELLQYRLTASIPWFLTVLGALQDAQTQGAVVSENYWHYDESTGTDKPCVDLFPIENLRIDPAANWVDPIGTSPYVIRLIPMYVGDIRQKMRVPDKRGQTWRTVSDATLRSAAQAYGDTTRAARDENREDPYSADKQSIGDYEVVWVQRHIHRKDGVDWHFYTLSDICLLSDPEPLADVVFHGHRPYTLGVCIIETHRVFPSSVPELSDGLQRESNEIANQRLDNLKLVLNKRYFVRRGKNVDLASLVRNVPGGITMADDPEADIKESSWPDVTSSAYQEQERIDTDLNELLGNFSPQALPNRRLAETASGAAMLRQPSNSLTEYLLRTFVETWVEPTLRQLVKLEQAYETDQVILALAAERANVFQKYGIDQITDELLDQELTLKVNVGMGASDPQMRLQKFMMATNAYQELSLKPPAGMNLGEVAKELYALTGYQDGRRFFTQEDPEKARLQAQIQELQKALQMASAKIEDKREDRVVQLKIAQDKNKTAVVTQQMKHKNENRQMLAEIFADQFMQPALANNEQA